jgi:WD40 repeat protein
VDRYVDLWNVAEKKHVESLSLQGNAGAVEAVVFSPDGKTLAAKSGRAAYLWDVEKRDLVGVLQGDAGWLYCLAFSPDSRLLALGGVDRAVSLWDVDTQEQIGY